MYHAYDEYKNWKKETYPATTDEWEGWAERIVQAFETEMSAGKKDFELIGRLQVENEKLQAERDALVRAFTIIQDGYPIDRWENIVDCYGPEYKKAKTRVESGKSIRNNTEAFMACYEMLRDLIEATRKEIGE